MPKALREPRFSNPGSGLYASIAQVNNMFVWRSRSAVGMDFPSPVQLKAGESVFAKDSDDYFILHYAVIWENKEGFEQYYIFSVAEDGVFVENQVDSFRLTLRSWLLFTAVLLVLILFLVLRWSLKPLRIMVKNLESIEAGEKTRLDGQYPSELVGLAGNLNALISSERAHLERYRNTLADLAHSLKTPLAILRGSIETLVVDKALVAEQISRMDGIVEYQLQKAAAKGRQRLTAKTDVSLLIKKIIISLEKVYWEKEIVFSFEGNDECMMYCQEGDVYEIAGNLLDNAAKWCSGQVNVSLIQLKREDDAGYSFVIQIEDDGPGIPRGKLNDILQRGVRADENIHGHGIEMAVVNELTALLGGQLKVGDNGVLDGMCWQVYLP
jgi:two-component system sensor histidine kinase PhoQ